MQLLLLGHAKTGGGKALAKVFPAVIKGGKTDDLKIKWKDAQLQGAVVFV